MRKYHKVENVCVKNGRLSLDVDGRHIEHTLGETSKALALAREDEQQVFEVSPSGYGIHWPLLDEDLSIDALMGIEHKPALTQKSA